MRVRQEFSGSLSGLEQNLRVVCPAIADWSADDFQRSISSVRRRTGQWILARSEHNAGLLVNVRIGIEHTELHRSSWQLAAERHSIGTRGESLSQCIESIGSFVGDERFGFLCGRSSGEKFTDRAIEHASALGGVRRQW